MAGTTGSKVKILAILEILRELSDEDHPLTALQIAAELENYGLTAERKAIYNDIDLLIDKGFDIIKNPAPAKGYYLGERDFQYAEVRLLRDAIEAAQFVTPAKTTELVSKVEKGLSKYQRATLRSQQVYIDNRNKSDNEQVYYWIDELARAIADNKKISVHYIKRALDVSDRPKNEEHVYKLTPYALVWVNDHYYLVANNNKYDNLMHLRIDKIKSVRTLEEEGRPLSEVSPYKKEFDAAHYLSSKFNMMSGKVIKVKIRCHEEDWPIIADRFGEDVLIVDRDGDYFTFVADAEPQGLSSWICQYNRMSVLEPLELRKTIKDRLKTMEEAYK